MVGRGAMEDAHASPPGPGVLEAWVSAVLNIAADRGSGVRVGELVSLLPPGEAMDEAGLHRWLAGHPEIARVEEGWAFGAQRERGNVLEREARSRRYENFARELLDGPLRSTLPWLRCVGITGSTAYGAPEDGDDLDFLVVARKGRLWLSVLRIYLSLWRARSSRRGHFGHPTVCFNYARDESTIRWEFVTARDPLFAREALTVRILFGDAYYRELLGASSWMAGWIPRLYIEQAQGAKGPPVDGPSASLWARAANGIAYVVLATYFQAAGLRRNARLRRSGRRDAVFRTQTVPGGLSFDSVNFEKIRVRYLSAIPPAWVPASTARGPGAVAGHPKRRRAGPAPPGRSAPGTAPDGDPSSSNG